MRNKKEIDRYFWHQFKLFAFIEKLNFDWNIFRWVFLFYREFIMLVTRDFKTYFFRRIVGKTNNFKLKFWTFNTTIMMRAADLLQKICCTQVTETICWLYDFFFVAETTRSPDIHYISQRILDIGRTRRLTAKKELHRNLCYTNAVQYVCSDHYSCFDVCLLFPQFYENDALDTLLLTNELKKREIQIEICLNRNHTILVERKQLELMVKVSISFWWVMFSYSIQTAEAWHALLRHTKEELCCCFIL